MAINAYTGLMGSGKTYEVVASVILPAIKAGRDVVTNIHGLNQEAIHEFLKQPEKGCTFGSIRIVKNEEIEKPEFFPEFHDEKFIVTDDTIVKPGNVVAIDEAWRPWGTTSKCVNAHMAFFREHRHCVNEKGISCDLALMTQDITDIHKLLKNVIEMSFLFTKLKTLGLAKRYRVEVYEGAKLYKTKRTSRTVSKYNPKIFPLYKSYSSDSGAGVEKAIDSRQNMLKQGAFFVPLLIAAGLIAFGAWHLYGFFHPDNSPATKTSDDSTPAAPGVPGAPVSTQSKLPDQQQNTQAGPASSSVETPGSTFSIAGTISIDGADWIVLSTPEGLRITSPSAVYSRGVTAITTDQNRAVPAYLSR